MENTSNIKNIIPTELDVAVEEEEEVVLIAGYNKDETDIITTARNNRNTLIASLIDSNPRGKELEGLLSLIDNQESSAHKTANTRLKIKEEDTNSKFNAGLIAILAGERDKERRDAAARNSTNKTRLILPSSYEPKDIVRGEMSSIDKTEQLNVDDFMMEGEE